MLTNVLEYQLDAAAFVAFAAVLLLSAILRLRRKHRIEKRSTFALAGWLLAVLGGIVGAQFAESHERARLRGTLEGMAPTYAQELELMGHADIRAGATGPNDPHYLTLIEAEKRWLAANPTVNDIYTLRRSPDGKTCLIVDSETDYDHSGAIDAEREKRTPIGDPYDATPSMTQAFDTEKPVFDGIPYHDKWGTWVSAYAPMRGKDGKLEALLGVDYDASTWTTSILLSRAAAFGLAAVVVVILLTSSVIVRITREELARRVLAEQQKQKLQEELLATSRKAGMADVATGVLHNVGNVLNSVNVSVRVVSEQLGASKTPNVARVAALLRDHAADLPGYFRDDPKAMKIPQYLVELAGVLAANEQAVMTELSALGRSVDHIKQIVASQQAFAKDVDQASTFDLAELLDDAVRINGLSTDAGDVALVKDYQPAGSGDAIQVHADKHRVMQIVVNLLSNAKKAVSRDGAPADRRVSVKARLADDDKNRRIVRVDVIDGGVGITAENLPKIFRLGFTTGGNGFGLHTAANDARRMGGALCVSSDGPMRGATFSLVMPVGVVAAVVKHE